MSSGDDLYAMRVRAALESGERLWQILVVKNLALLAIVAPFGFLLSVVLAWQAGDGLLILFSCVGMWVLLTVFATALAQQPKVRRTLQREIADYRAAADARALAAEREAAAGHPSQPAASA